MRDGSGRAATQKPCHWGSHRPPQWLPERPVSEEVPVTEWYKGETHLPVGRRISAEICRYPRRLSLLMVLSARAVFTHVRLPSVRIRLRRPSDMAVPSVM